MTLGKLSLASPVNAGAFSMLFGLVVVPVVSLITKPRESDVKATNAAFSCYDAV